MQDNEPQDIPGLAKYLPSSGPIPPGPTIYTNCKKCGEELYGGEKSGPDADGYCDSCNW